MQTVPKDVKYVILVINGRTEEKIVFAKIWLDYLKSIAVPPKTIIVMLGNEVSPLVLCFLSIL